MTKYDSTAVNELIELAALEGQGQGYGPWDTHVEPARTPRDTARFDGAVTQRRDRAPLPPPFPGQGAPHLRIVRDEPRRSAPPPIPARARQAIFARPPVPPAPADAPPAAPSYHDVPRPGAMYAPASRHVMFSPPLQAFAPPPPSAPIAFPPFDEDLTTRRPRELVPVPFRGKRVPWPWLAAGVVALLAIVTICVAVTIYVLGGATPPLTAPAPVAIERTPSALADLVRVAPLSRTAPIPTAVAPQAVELAAEPKVAPTKLVEVLVESVPAGARVTLIDGDRIEHLGATPITVAVDPQRSYELMLASPAHQTHVVRLDPSTTRRLAVPLATTTTMTTRE